MRGAVSPVSTRQKALDHGVRIVPMRVEHMEAVRKLHEDLFPVRYRDKFYHDILHAPLHYSLVALLRNEERCTHSGGSSAANATRENAIQASIARDMVVGLATARVQIKDGSCAKLRKGYIMTLGTRSDHRRKGIAKRLLKAINEILEEVGRSTETLLHCTTTNTSALRLYANQGFRIMALLHDHYHFHGQSHDAYELCYSRNESTCCGLHEILSSMSRMCCARFCCDRKNGRTAEGKRT